MADEKKLMNRWLVVVGALLIQISLGAIYIYSVFKPALKEQFKDWSATDLALPAQLVLLFFALSMVVAGLSASGLTRIDDVSCINKSFPEFLEVLNSLI